MIIRGFPWTGAGGVVRYLAKENMLQLMKIAMALGEVVIPANIFAHIKQADDVNREADLLEALPSNGFFKGLPRQLSTTR